MRASVLTAIAASSLAAAAPATPAHPTGYFSVSGFVYGCTAGCSYSFKVTVAPSFMHHPEVETAVACSGSLEDKDYKACGKINGQQSISAYIDKATSKLKLKYVVNEVVDDGVYRYEGEKEVYAATGPQASQQKPAFTVDETVVTSGRS